MPERVKKAKCGGGGCCEKKLRGVCRRGVKKTKCRGGGEVAKKNLRWEVCRRGYRRQNAEGVLRNKLTGG